MKTRLTFSFVLVLAIACGGCWGRASGPEAAPPSAAPDPLSADWDDRSVYEAGLIESERPALDGLPGATVYHVDLVIPRDRVHLEGREQVRYTNREDGPLEAIYFRLFPNATGGAMAVSSVRAGDEDVEPVYESMDSALRVPLPTPLQPGEQVILELDFAVEVPREMGGNYGLLSYSDRVLAMDSCYPIVAVYDDEGWNVEPPPPNADLTYLDASFYLVRVTAPSKLTVAASGIEVGRERAGRNQRVTFAAGPARDFYIAASDRYEVVSERVGETTVHSYALRRRTEGAELALEVASNALRSFNDRFGPYPYTELDVAATPMLAMGIEYPGIVGISMDLYDPRGERDDVPVQVYLESTVAHEVAHQWFYNAVGNDQVGEPWLDEALAQYATWLYYLDVRGRGGAQGFYDYWQSCWGRVDREPIPIGLPAEAYGRDQYVPIVYCRGPLFLEALSKEMGAAYDPFLREFYAAQKWGIATTGAFRALAEEHCGCDLGPLFEAWVYGGG